MSDTQADLASAAREAALPKSRQAAEQMPCCGAKPPQFEAFVIVGPRMVDPKKWCASVRVRCFYCERTFKFEGLPGGVFGGGQPSTVSHHAYDALLPIEWLRNEQFERILKKTDPWPGCDKQSAAPVPLTPSPDTMENRAMSAG